MKRFFFVVFLGGLILFTVVGANFFIFLKTPSQVVVSQFTIEKGMSLNRVIQDLQSRGIVSSAPLFKGYILFKKASSKIRAGDYVFPAGLTPPQVLALLLKGDFTLRRVTLPEGWTHREAAQFLGGLQLVNEEIFIAKCGDPVFISTLGLSAPHLEGYLFPDTYEIYKPKDEEEVLRKFVERFKEVYATHFQAKTQELGLSQQEVVTLASIVEKETGTDKERSLIASVFWNRLKKGMPLASDPTVIYGIAHFSGNLKREDLSRPGPYNTYLNVGLPPTPIANPGLESLKAVLYPAESDYLFFVSKNDGTHHFSKTEEEHAMAVKKYQLERPKQRSETLPTTSTRP